MTRLRLRRDLVWREAGEEIIALDGGPGRYVSTNAAGRVLWRALADGASREDLVRELVAGFAIDPGRAARDVDAYLAELEEKGLLEA
jgi:Coenzyme PQQ synthesis protein D (PqqD)